MEKQEERIRHLFGMRIEAKMAMADALSPIIAKAGKQLVNCLLNDNKIVLCGYGGSAANCLHFSSAMMNSCDVDRPPLPVITLSTDPAIFSGLSNGAQSDLVFARQIQALGQQGDLLIALTTSGNSNGIFQAITAAHYRGMDVIVLNGRDGGLLMNHIGPEDTELRVGGENTAAIREMHLFILHCFCDLIDQSLFGQMTE